MPGDDRARGPASLLRFADRFGGVATVAFLTYIGEYMSFIVVLAFIINKLVLLFHMGGEAYLLVGAVSALYLVLSGLVAIPVGHLSDRYGKRRFTMLGCLLGAFALFSLVFIDRMTDPTQFFAGIAVSLGALGVAHGTYTATTLAYTGDVADASAMGKPYSLVEDAEFVGYAFGPALGAVVSVALGRILTFTASGLMLLAAAAMAFFFMRRAGGEAHSVSWSDFASAFRNSVVALILVTTFFSSLAFSGFFYYVPLYASALKGSIPALGAVYPVLQSLVAGTAVVLMFPFGHLTDRTGRRMPYLVAGLLIGALALASVFLAPSLGGFLLASVVFGLSLALARVNQLVMLAEASTQANRAGVMGTNHAMEHAGYGAGALVGGIIAGLLGGFVSTFRYLSVMLVVVGLVFLAVALAKKMR
ncbi:MAG: MFS transporter [Nitrososphaerota archaeon]|nr:MFS transporter [Nitrososphaerota archaeon]